MNFKKVWKKLFRHSPESCEKSTIYHLFVKIVYNLTIFLKKNNYNFFNKKLENCTLF